MTTTCPDDYKKNPPVKLTLQKSIYSDKPNLPIFEERTILDNGLQYNGIDITSFCSLISDIYESVKSWKNNMFEVPPGAQSKKFIALMNFWLDQFNKDTPWGNIALKVFMILPNIFL